MQSGEFVDGELSRVLESSRRILLRDKTGAASTDLWSFCIGAQFVTMKINTKIHAMFQSGSFSTQRYFKCTTGSPYHMMAQLEALLQTSGE
jgi:hypothetical protein